MRSLLEKHGLEPLELEAKEGRVSRTEPKRCSPGSLLLHAERLADLADITGVFPGRAQGLLPHP